jgi:hypothetical protein
VLALWRARIATPNAGPYSTTIRLRGCADLVDRSRGDLLNLVAMRRAWAVPAPLTGQQIGLDKSKRRAGSRQEVAAAAAGISVKICPKLLPPEVIKKVEALK